jgi:hypothetical protein
MKAPLHLAGTAGIVPSMQGTIQRAREFSEGIESLRAQSLDVRRRLFEEMQPFLAKSLQLQRRFLKVAKPFRDTVLRQAGQGWPKFAEPLNTLAENGWFISFSRTPVAWIYPLARLFEKGRKREGHQRLRAHFNKHADETEAYLARHFPRRGAILRKAFSAHRNRDYELSIPVFLAQADGIALEIIGTSAYSRSRKNLAKLKAFVASLNAVQLQSELLKLLLLAIPLNVSTGDSLLVKGVLNRHEILHGVNTNYASATNSCRSISWLEYVAHLRHAKDLAERKRRDRE